MTAEEYIGLKDLEKESDRDITGILWYDESINQENKINISFELFDRSPEYGICAELNMAYSEMKIEIRDILWSKYRQYLKSGTNEQKEQIKYSLWVDFFEDQETVQEAWSQMINVNNDIQIIRQTLSISGPLPFDKKDELYSQVITDKHNHEYILDSLAGSLYDVFGQIDIKKGRELFAILEVDKTSEKYIKLNHHLNRFNSKRELHDYLINEKKDDNKL